MGVVLVLVLSGCSVRFGSSFQHADRAESEQLASTGQAAAAVRAVDDWSERNGPITIGVVVWDRRTGDLDANLAAAEPMFAASMAKLMLAVDVLERPPVGPDVRQLLARALSFSDDGAMNDLWARFGGEAAIAGLATRLRLRETTPPRELGRWGETVTSARDISTIYRHLLRDMPPADREFVVGSLAAAAPRATDGFDQRFGLLGVGGYAVKSAWACCRLGKIWLHSAGLTDDRFVVTLLSNEFSTSGFDGARESLTAAAEAAVAPLRQ